MANTKELSRTRKAALFVVAIAIFTDMLIYGLVVPILPGYASSLGVSQTAIGFLFSSYAITLFIATPIFGLLSDRIGRRGPMLWGLLGLAAATILFSIANSYILLIVARALQGVAAAVTWTAGLALLADLYPPEERGKAMGIALSGQAAGTLLGPTVGGWFYELGGYQAPFLFAAGLALFDGVLRLILLRDIPSSKSENYLSPFKVMRDRRLLIIAGVVIIGASVPSVLEPTLPIHLQKHFNITPGYIGLLFAVPTLSYGLLAPVIGTFSIRIGHIKTIIIGLIMVSISLPLTILPDTIWIQALAMGLLGISMALVLTPSLPELANVSEQSGVNAYGLTFAIYNTAYSIGMMIGPMISSTLTDVFGLKLAYIAVGCIIIFYLPFMRTLIRENKKKDLSVKV
ncbi:MFS transporter [Bacillus chungangensis]|uniref:Multidrug resistance protein n=1 Tax=Bacillus chungangensis TaxID=587633 RepID=A0ABT9WXV7_9BACI|nr:MFS transporter [Bacillus chungangensis]MDQ0178062.1 multidrug resistance protein [Bacillus chungangensis]